MASTEQHTILDTATVRAALDLAVRAPSIHNTQPWRWQLRDGVLTLRADRARQLEIADPDGHSLLISCGAALVLTELGLRAQGWTLDIGRLPHPGDPEVIAEFRGLRRGAPAQADVDRAAAAARRHSERRPFGPGDVSPDELEALRSAAARPEVFAHFPIRDEEKLNLAIAVSHADRFERTDADYLAEMARWVHAEANIADGVPVTAIPHVVGDEPRHSNIPLRDFEVGLPGGQLIQPGIDEQPLIAVVFTTANGPRDQLAGGEAMMRMMIEAELIDLAGCPISQSLDMVAFRTRLRTMMNWREFPQMMLRFGRRPSGTAAPLTRRRPLEEVFQIIE